MGRLKPSGDVPPFVFAFHGGRPIAALVCRESDGIDTALRVVGLLRDAVGVDRVVLTFDSYTAERLASEPEEATVEAAHSLYQHSYPEGLRAAFEAGDATVSQAIICVNAQADPAVTCDVQIMPYDWFRGSPNPLRWRDDDTLTSTIGGVVPETVKEVMSRRPIWELPQFQPLVEVKGLAVFRRTAYEAARQHISEMDTMGYFCPPPDLIEAGDPEPPA